YQPDVVYHAAAYKHVPLMEDNPCEAISTNIKGTMNIVDCAIKYQVEKFVMVSTDKAVNPTNVMGATKRIAELYVSRMSKKHKQTKFITTRFGNVLGSNGSVIPLFKKQILKGGPLTVTHKEVTRYFMTIPEACQLVLEAGVMGEGGEIFVFDMGESVKIYDLAKRMIQLSGLHYPKDIDIEIVGLRPGEKVFEELLADGENTLQTHHEKILKAQVRDNKIENFEVIIKDLIKFDFTEAEKQMNMKLVSVIKKLAPEYISENSIYESLDPDKVS
ncbi:MAG: polysaccharide biosynthesis protein, partial [Psychroflexus sp.]|nr:polysaccharide biosynthesis protein [Psychroflexus sp.]